MKKFGLIGHPIKDSLSPKIFNAAYNGKYPYELIEEQDYATAFSKFIAEYEGINITSPFKYDAYLSADILSRECEITNAANILIKKNKQIKAYNSDVRGVIYCLQKCEQYSTALIVGCGGAGRAAAYAALLLGMNIGLINRTYEKAIQLKQLLQETEEGKAATIEVYAFENLKEEIEKNCIIINTVSEKIKGFEELNVESRKFIIEANYTNPTFAKLANENIVYISGKDWLLGQAIAAYKIMTGEAPNIKAMHKVL